MKHSCSAHRDNVIAPCSAQDADVPDRETKLVIVNLAVKDKSGRPITNLKKEDVEILEDGVRSGYSRIRVAELVGGAARASVVRSYRAAHPRRERRCASAGKAVVAPTPNNPIRYQDRRLLCLFFDMTSMDPPEQLRAQEAAIKFLRSQMTSSDLVEIMTYTTAMKVVQEWTDDRDSSDRDAAQTHAGRGQRPGGYWPLPRPMRTTTAAVSPPMRPNSTSSIPTAN